jgi:hypothetical protein
MPSPGKALDEVQRKESSGRPSSCASSNAGSPFDAKIAVHSLAGASRQRTSYPAVTRPTFLGSEEQEACGGRARQGTMTMETIARPPKVRRHDKDWTLCDAISFAVLELRI